MLRISHQKGQWSLRFAYISFRFQCDITSGYRAAANTVLQKSPRFVNCSVPSGETLPMLAAFTMIHHDSPVAQVESGRADASGRSRLSCKHCMTQLYQLRKKNPETKSGRHWPGGLSGGLGKDAPPVLQLKDWGLGGECDYIYNIYIRQ